VLSRPVPHPQPHLHRLASAGDGESVVAEPAAARRRWNGRSGCAPAPVYATASLVQFRCQAKGHLPFMMWYRENVFGNWSGWDAKAAALRAEAVKVPRDSSPRPLDDVPHTTYTTYTYTYT